MKILIVSMLFYPDNRIGAFRPTNFAKHLAQLGHKVSVITTKKTVDINIPGLVVHQVDTNGFSKFMENMLSKRKKELQKV